MPEPDVESVVPSYERPEPITRVPTWEVPFPFKMPVSVVDPVPPLATDNCVPDQLPLLIVESVASEPSPETWPDGSDRFGKVVMPETDVEALRRLSKSVPKVVVYTPFVTVPAFPVIAPVMVFEKVLVPLKVLSFARSVEDAAVTVMFPVPSKDVPLIVRAVARAVAVAALPPIESDEVATSRNAEPAGLV